MKRLTEADFSLGTLVLKTGTNKGYGIVVDQAHWLEESKKEDPKKVKSFCDLDVEHGCGFMIPILRFGHVIGSRLKKKGKEIREEFYVERYIWSNVGGDITIIPRIDRLQSILDQMLLFFGGANADYIEQVRHDLQSLKFYLEGGYNLESPKLSPYYRDMIRIFEKAIPRDKYFEVRNEYV